VIQASVRQSSVHDGVCKVSRVWLDGAGGRAALRFWDGTCILVSAAGVLGCVEDGEHSDPVRRSTDRRGLNPASAFVQDGWTLVEGAR